MKISVIVQNKGKIDLTDKNYVGRGGEACVYAKGKTAFKIYHDPARMIPAGKVQELSAIKAPNVCRPTDIICDTSNNPIGYTTPFARNVEPICKVFTKSFKKANNISEQVVVNMVKSIQKTIMEIHAANCLVVDLNEMNLLASTKDFTNIAFIDVDSYQTPSYPATAIMDSVRDRLIKNNKWNQGSDWFAFAVIAFQLYIGAHPYKGKHPNYKPNDLVKRMDDNVSCFDINVKLPPVCNDLSVIPKNHLQWMKSLFVDKDRSIPPMPADVSLVIQIPTQVVMGTESFEVNLVREYPEDILRVFNFMGVNYAIGTDHAYKDGTKLPINVQGFDKVLCCSSTDMTPIFAKMKENHIDFENLSGNSMGSIDGKAMIARNGCIYSMLNGKLTENSFAKLGAKTVHRTRHCDNVLDMSTKAHEGMFVQDLLGKCYLTIPYEQGRCFSGPVKELDKYRILEAKSEGNVCVLLGEKGGKYDLWVVTFSDNFRSYKTRKIEDVPYGAVNMTTLPNGVGILVLESEVQIFKDASVKVVNDPPFDTSTRIFNINGDVYYIDGEKVIAAKMKKQP